MRIVVVLPAPLGPRNPNTSPASTRHRHVVDAARGAVALGQRGRARSRRSWRRCSQRAARAPSAISRNRERAPTDGRGRTALRRSRPSRQRERGTTVKAAVVRSFDRPLEIEELPIPEPGDRPGARAHRDLRALPHRHPRRARRVAGQAVAAVHPRPRGRRASSSASATARCTASSRACASRCRGSATPAASAATATAGARRSASSSRTWATRSTAASPSTRSATPATSCASRTASTPPTPSPLTCAGVTTYKAVKDSGARSSSLVAVFGVGGLGHLAVQYARITGASVVAVDINPARLESARAVGAEHLVNPLEEDPVAAIQRARRRRRGDRHRGQPEAVRAGLRLARPRRQARLRRAAGRQPHRAADLRDRARRPRHPRLDRRHPPRPRGGLRAAPPRPDHARVRRSARSTTSTRRSSRCSTAAPRRRGSCSGWASRAAATERPRGPRSAPDTPRERGRRAAPAPVRSRVRRPARTVGNLRTRIGGLAGRRAAARPYVPRMTDQTPRPAEPAGGDGLLLDRRRRRRARRRSARPRSSPSRALAAAVRDPRRAAGDRSA